MLSFPTLFHPSSSVAQQSFPSPNTCMAEGVGFDPREVLLRWTKAKGAGTSSWVWGEEFFDNSKKTAVLGEFPGQYKSKGYSVVSIGFKMLSCNRDMENIWPKTVDSSLLRQISSHWTLKDAAELLFHFSYRSLLKHIHHSALGTPT